MAGRNGGDREGLRVWLQGIIVIVVIAGALGIFGSQSSLERPQLGPLNIAGLVIMFVGLALALLSAPLSEKLQIARQDLAAVAFRLGGVLVCVAGALMVFL